jgi:hypothetical protein
MKGRFGNGPANGFKVTLEKARHADVRSGMILKFFGSGESSPEKTLLEYLLENPSARVIRGNPETTQAVIDMRYPGTAQPFTAGVLYGCTWLGLENEQRLINELQIQLLAGRPADSMPWCVVAHGYNVKCFVIPNFDPVFGKVVHPYVAQIDRCGLLAWAEHYSLRHGLPSPNDHFRVEPDFGHLRIASVDVAFLRHVWQQVHDWVRAGVVRDRMDLELWLMATGYRVRCNKHTSGPLEQPVILGPRGNLLRLTGSIYYRPEFGQKPAENHNLNDPQVLKKRLGELREAVLKRLDFRAYHLVGRLFGSREQLRVRHGTARHHLKSLIDQKLNQDGW